MTDEEIKRINFLARKSKESGLSDEEKEEQVVLRRKYIDSVLGSLKSELDNTTVIYPDGKAEKLAPKNKKPF